MPCYTEWDAYLEKGSDQYAAAKKELEAKLKAVRHIVDYYYKVEGFNIPHAQHTGERAFLEMAELSFKIDKHEMNECYEEKIIKSIAHHFSCDGIHFNLLYDLNSLLNVSDPMEAGYARVILACANKIRSGF